MGGPAHVVNTFRAGGYAMMTDSNRFDSHGGAPNGVSNGAVLAVGMPCTTIVRATGEFAWWTQAAQEALADFGLADFLQSAIRRCDVEHAETLELMRGAWLIRVTRLSGPGPVHYLVALTPHARRPGDVGLSPAQLRVSRLAATGATARDIAQLVGIAPGTVRTHLSIVYRKLNVTTRVGLARALEGW